MVVACINYVKPPADNETRFILDTHWSGATADPHQMEISDARRIQRTPNLDREGFSLLDLGVGDLDYSDLDLVESKWTPAAREQVLAATGASWATSWATNIRFSNRSEKSTSTTVSAPARKAHADLTPIFKPGHLPAQPVAERASREYKSRYGDTEPDKWRVVNLWQQISPPPTDTPLAMCDLTSVKAEDLVIGHGAFMPGDEPSFQLTFLKHNPAHQWRYFSDMRPGEAILFSGLAPDDAPLYGRTPHIAFDMPKPPRDVVPRNSIEIRWLLTYD